MQPVSDLAEGHRANEVHVACPADLWVSIASRLRGAAPLEACVLMLTRPSTGSERVTVLISEPIWPQAGDVRATEASLELSADYITRGLDAAADAGPSVGVALIHTHPPHTWGPGRGRFSPRDDWYDARFFETVLMGRPSAIGASIVLGSESHDLDARIFWRKPDGLACQSAHAVRVVGPTLTVIETPHSTWREHPDPAVMNRSMRVLGREGQRLLQNLRIGIIGLGGTGSISLTSLATMGAGRLQCWDHDTVSAHGRPRMLASQDAHVGQPKVVVLSAAAKLSATAKPFHIEAYDEWGTSANALRLLRDCDLIFSCVDLFGARVPLNDLAYSHLIPVIDMGTKVYPDGDGIGDILSHAQVLGPGLPCAWCNGTITPQRLVEEAQGLQRGAEHRIPYGVPVAATDGVEPSVLPFNLATVGLAMLHFMQVVFHVATRTANDLRLILPGWELDESDLGARPGCSCSTDLAKGDTITINPFLVPEPKESGNGGEKE